MLKPCLICGKPTEHTRCDRCAAALRQFATAHQPHRPKAATTTQRGYGWTHQRRRARMVKAALNTRCPAQASPNCDGLMVNPRRMHLDHSTPRALGGTHGDRVICAPCNTYLGGRLGAARRGRGGS